MMEGERVKSWKLFVAILCCLECGARSQLNVRDFGAKGDGKTDDTAAIQAAADTALKQRRGMRNVRGAVRCGNSVTQPEVIFPSGRYLVRDTIRVNGGEFIVRGVGAPIIHMDDDGKDVFSSQDAWRMRISGLTFQNGRRQLALSNENLDSGLIVIENCRFNLSAAQAIELSLRSTVVYVEKCIFRKCEQALTSTTDMVTMRSCWITSSPAMANKAVIESHGEQLLFEDMTLVPLVSGTGQRWIDNRGCKVICRSTRFGGEGGGFTPVYNFAKPKKQGLSTSVVIENCWVCANASHNANCAVYCLEAPNMIIVRGNDLCGAKPVIVKEGLDLTSYFEGIPPRLLHFLAADNVGPARNEMPELLRDPVCPPGEKIGISDREAEALLNAAAREVSSRGIADATGLSVGGRTQKSAEGDFLDVSPGKHKWDLTDKMDATTVPNSTHLAMRAVGDDTIVLRRTDSGGNWPHIAIGPVEVDLDAMPWLTYKLKDLGPDRHPGHAIKVIDVDTGNMVLVGKRHWPPYYEYQGVDLRKLLGSGGRRKLVVRFYYTGIRNVKKESLCDKTGDYLLIDFIRFEKE